MHKGFNERPEVKSNPSMDIAAMNRMVEWHPIGQTSNQLILYHPPSHALSVQPHPPPLAESSSTGLERSRRASLPSYRPRPLLLPYGERAETPIESIERQPEQELNTASCPYCLQPLPGGLDPFASSVPFQPTTTTNAYFRVLEQAHEGSRPPSPGLRVRSRGSSGTPKPGGRSILDPIAIDEGEEEEEEAESRDVPARGYYDRFFKEECRLGMGAEGSVYLATHVIGGNVLGTYAVKKIAVGDNKDYLVKMLREVRLLEALRHPNIIPYHHSWIDLTRFSSFGPPITALHVLMMYATAGNLDSFLLNRSNSKEPFKPDLSAGGIADSESLGQLPKLERIKAFKKRRQSGTGSTRKKEETRGVLLLGLEEIVKLFGDVVEGLAFLHANSILHLDLKCSNVLLHWEEGKLIPKAMISDFGTSEEMLRGNRERTGHTGTMEYMAPETLVVGANGHWRPSDSHADMWSLGMILHKLLFLHLPYTDTEDFDNLQVQILEYPGFVLTSDLIRSCERRHIPRDLLHLLSKLVHVNPESRPTAEKVRTGIRGITVKPASSGINGIVTRFIRPQNIDINATSPLSRDNIINTAEYSPVRPMLALPSPILETAPSVSPTLPKWTTAHLTDQHKTMIHTGLFVLKVLSLQSSITGINPPPFAAVLLLAGALVSLFMATWGIELASTTVHVALLVAIRQKVTMEVTNCVQPM